MHRVLLVSVRFHDGRYHGAGDWPPSPARLFQALVAGAARGQTIADRPRTALYWLENLDAPIIATPTSREGRGFKNFVPNNDLDAVGGDLRRIGAIRTSKTIRPHLFDAAHPFLYTWKFEPGEAAERYAQTIARIAECLYQLGRGVDMAWAWGEVIAAEDAEARLAMHGGVVYRPSKAGGNNTLATPITGSLDSLIQRYKETRKRFQTLYEPSKKAPGQSVAVGQIFSQPRRPRFGQVAYDSPTIRFLFDLRAGGNQKAEPDFAAWPLAQAVAVVTMVRDRAAASLSKHLPAKKALVERVLIGRDATEADKTARVRIVPLPSVGHAQADHAIRRMLVEVPPNCPLAAGDIEWSFSGLDLGAEHQTGEVVDEAGPVLTARAERGMLRHYGIESAQPACVWRTVTPAVLAQAAARRRIDQTRLHDPAERKGAAERTAEQNRAAGAVIQALRHAGVTRHISAIRVQREPFTGKGERAEAFAPGTRFAKERLWHVEIAFAQPVDGPLIIGDGRYLGLGLMQPVSDVRCDVAVFGLAAEQRIASAERMVLLSAVRRALMSLSRRSDGSVPRLFSGHETDGAPAQSGRHEHVFLAAADLDRDGRIDRLIVAAPWRCDRSVQSRPGDAALFDRVVTALAVVRAGKLGVLSLAMDAAGAEDRRLVGPARIWESHAGYSPTRPVRTGDDPVEVLRRDVMAECRRRNLPSPEVELLDHSSCGCGNITGHLRLSFAAVVLGPVILGRESHKGGGLFLAVS